MQRVVAGLLGFALTCALRAAEERQAGWSLVALAGQQGTVLQRILFVDGRVGWICAGMTRILKTIDVAWGARVTTHWDTRPVDVGAGVIERAGDT